jgi:hypothetical protein
MVIRITIPFLVLLVLLSSCEPQVRFEVPQPEGKQDERKVPAKLLGTYISDHGSTKLMIYPGLIVKSAVGYDTAFISELDSADRQTFKSDTSIVGEEGLLKYGATIRGDSIFQQFEIRDTLLELSSGDVLRKFKGYYFINRRISDNRWNVLRLRKGKNGVSIGSVTSPEEIAALREITGVSSDTVFDFKPSRKELRKFVDDNGFSSEEIFIKTK